MSMRDLSRALAEVVREVSRSVITIYTVRPSLESFFGLTPLVGAGSGFIVGEGLAVTNYHVVRGAGVVEVVYGDGVRGGGRVLAHDPGRDLALLAVDRRDVKPIRLGDSDKLEPGELVLVVGSPLGLQGPSISLGVVSAIGRTLVDQESGVILEDLIQTDAAINPGNSGGPIVNASGEAVGVTTAIIARAQGIGFAIPINTVRRFIAMIEKYGRPLRAWIGVYVAPLTAEIASMLGVAVKEGVVVVRVMPRTPAHIHGLREGDVIVKAAGRKVKSVRELREAIEDSVDQGCVELEVLRGRSKIEDCVPVVVEEIA
ncbi:MAG: trypsin-like peptidase domain-containing protein [Desulfurococcaceae archaeon]|nr:trypsin-like peptidase domain-containing protein [Desulfurococcaceae archaeon]MCC6060428.1 trypsin-like peptidase domain-containing protein [Desulfurococcaceae archaeon]